MWRRHFTISTTITSELGIQSGDRFSRSGAATCSRLTLSETSATTSGTWLARLDRRGTCFRQCDFPNLRSTVGVTSVKTVRCIHSALEPCSGAFFAGCSCVGSRTERTGLSSSPPRLSELISPSDSCAFESLPMREGRPILGLIFPPWVEASSGTACHDGQVAGSSPRSRWNRWRHLILPIATVLPCG